MNVVRAAFKFYYTPPPSTHIISAIFLLWLFSSHHGKSVGDILVQRLCDICRSVSYAPTSLCRPWRPPFDVLTGAVAGPRLFLSTSKGVFITYAELYVFGNPQPGRGFSFNQKKPGREGTGSFSQARCLQVMHRRVPLQVSDAPPFSLQRNPVSLCNGVIRLYGGRLLLQEKRMTTTSRPSSSPQALRFPILRPAFSCMAGSIRAHASWTAPAPLVPSVSRRKRIRADTSPSSQIFCLRRSEKPLTYFFRRTDGSYPYSCTHPYPRHKRNRRYW